MTDATRSLSANEPSTDWPSLGIANILARQREHAPGKFALAHRGGTLDYAGLDDAVGRAASALRASQIAPGTRIALLGHKQIGIVAAYLAGLSEGLAVVPIDSRYPSLWVDEIVGRLGISIGVSEDNRIPVSSGLCRWLPLSELANGPADWPETRAIAPTATATIFRTSGSTGQPKFVEHSHANLAASFAAIDEMLDFCAEDVVVNIASISFSSSLRQLIHPLLHGATVILVDREMLGDPAALAALLFRYDAGILELVPSLMRVLASAYTKSNNLLADARLLPLRLVCAASEPLPYAVVRQWQRAFPDWPILHLYGATETTGIVAARRLPQPIPEAEVGLVPIGPAVGANRLEGRSDAAGRLELHVASPQVARYVEDGTGAEWFGTGDLVEPIADGGYRWLGRSDDQAKLLGVRFSCEEIAALISDHSTVHELAVAAITDPSTDRPRLVAFFVPALSDRAVAVRQLRQHAVEVLPEGLVPSFWVPVEMLPRGPNSKLDRQELLRWAARYLADQQSAAQPGVVTDLLRAKVEAIWADRLERNEMPSDADFHALGGDSLAALLIISDIKRAFSVLLPLDTIQVDGSLARFTEQLARLIAEQARKPAAS